MSLNLDFADVLIVPKSSTIDSRSKVDLTVAYSFEQHSKESDNVDHNHLENLAKESSEGKPFDYSSLDKPPNDNIVLRDWHGIPIIAANMDSTGTFETYKVLSKHKMLTAFNKHYTKEDFLKLKEDGVELDKEYFMLSTGIGEDDVKKLEEIMEVVDTKWICVDIANGYLEKLRTVCKYLSTKYKDKILVAGNVATPDIIEPLKDSGVDVIKVGIGGGSACTTRIKTGIGVPQFTAVSLCVAEARKLDVKIISDGGITCPGDVSKAFVAGAHFVMIGGEFAGHDQTTGEIVEKDGKKFKEFYGMSSRKAIVKHTGVMDEYRSSEGRELLIPYKGDLNDTVLDYLGGIRSTCTYIDAAKLENMHQDGRFMHVSNQFNRHLI